MQPRWTFPHDDDDADDKEGRRWLEKLAENEHNLQRQAYHRAKQEVLVARIERAMRTQGVSWDEAVNRINNDDRLEEATRLEAERLRAYYAAKEEAEGRAWRPPAYRADDDDERPHEVKSAPLAISQSGSKGGTPFSASGRFTGLAAVIGGQPDSYGDIIQPGAFTKTIAEARAKGKPYLYPLLYQHDPTRPIGGVASAEERPGGLYVECQLDLNTTDGKEAFSLISGGYLDGMSIGYIATRDGYRGNVRELREVRLLECSIVTFPANDAAQVSRVA